MYVPPVYRHCVPLPDGYNGWFTVGARQPCLGNMGAAGCGVTVQESHGGLTSEYALYTTTSDLVYHSWMISTGGNHGWGAIQGYVIHG